MVKKVLKPVICLFVIAALLCLADVPSAEAGGQAFLWELSRAEGNLKFSPKSSIHLGLEVQGTWDDNIYSTSIDEDKIEDYITTVTPGLFISLGDRYKLEAGYAFGANFYSEYTDEDYEENIARARIKLDFPGGFRIDAASEYLDTTDARTAEGAERESYFTNDASGSIAYTFPAKKLSVEIACTEFYLKYDEEAIEALNRKEDACSGVIYYRFLPKTSMLIEGEYSIIDYYDSANEDIDPDSTSNAANVGFMWDATAKLFGKLTAGGKRRVYENEAIYGEKNDLWAVYGNLLYKATERTGIKIDMDRSINESVYIGSVEYSPAVYYIQTGGGIGIEQKLGTRVTLEVGAAYHKRDYGILVSSLEKREDEITRYNVGFGCDITKWLFTGIRYSYSKIDSNDITQNQEHNKAFLTVSAAL
jgi:hypothetical protein